MEYMKLSDYSLRGEIDNAVKLLYEARNNNMTHRLWKDVVRLCSAT